MLTLMLLVVVMSVLVMTSVITASRSEARLSEWAPVPAGDPQDRGRVTRTRR